MHVDMLPIQYAVDHVPEVQLRHDAVLFIPVPVWYWPGWHDPQLSWVVAPVVSEYLPMVHGVHVVILAAAAAPDHVPLAQNTHVELPTCPVDGWKVPGGHCAQDVLDELPLDVVLKNMPVVHGIHTAALMPPATVDHVPIMQAVHDALDGWPVNCW